jgi:hypothetical protein
MHKIIHTSIASGTAGLRLDLYDNDLLLEVEKFPHQSKTTIKQQHECATAAVEQNWRYRQNERF